MCANEKLQADYERKLERLKSRSWLATYLDQKQPQASSWLKVMPAEKALSFTDNEWTATLRYFVAIPDGRLNLIPGQTCACGAAFTETHSENCKLRGWLTRRSDTVIGVALEEARDCLWRTDQERAIPVNQQGNPSEGRMDGVCWPSGTASGKPISFDVTVVSPSAAGVVVKNSKHAGWAVEVAEEVKRNNGYGPFVKQQGHRFFGAGIATSGYFGKGFLQFRKQIHKNVPHSASKEFDLDPGTNPNVQRGVDRTFWFAPSRFDYYTARIAVALKIALVRQTNDVIYANIDKRALSSRQQREQSEQTTQVPPRRTTSADTTFSRPPGAPVTPPSDTPLIEDDDRTNLQSTAAAMATAPPATQGRARTPHSVDSTAATSTLSSAHFPYTPSQVYRADEVEMNQRPASNGTATSLAAFQRANWMRMQDGESGGGRVRTPRLGDQRSGRMPRERKIQGEKNRDKGGPTLQTARTKQQGKARSKFVQASTRLGETDHTGGRPNGGQMCGAGAAPMSARSSGPARNTNGTTALRSRPTHLPAVSMGSGPRLSEVGGRRGTPHTHYT